MTEHYTGGIFRIHFPFAEGEGFKLRPALALSEPDAYGDIRWAFITSRPVQERKCIALTGNDFEGPPLPRASYLVPDKTFIIHKGRIDRKYTRLTNQTLAAILKSGILADTREYSRLAHRGNLPGDDPARVQFTPDQTIPYAARVFTADEVEAAVSSTLDFWLTLGPEGAAMETELADFLGVRHSLLVNSGSSANLVAFSALTTHKLPEHKRILPGDEVITVAAGFPTTVAPIIQCGAVPVFIDAIVKTGNADCSMLEAAYTPGKTKAVMMAHALGNPFELVTVLEFCQKYDLWLIEDNCDALGCTYTLPLEKAKALGLDHLIKIAEKGHHPIIRIHAGEKAESGKRKAESQADDVSAEPASLQPSSFNLQLFLTAPTGTFGDLSTQSFYPPHHLTMGEGGAVNIIRKPALKSYAESFRDWGRDCWCPSGKDDTCGKRFQWQLGELPAGYDHKYIYSHLGYNLKPLDTQAAIGRVQIRRLPDFIEARRRNWEYLRRGLAGLEDCIDFALPTHATSWSAENGFVWDPSGCRTDCSWFGFKMTIREDAPFTRTELAQELDARKIGNRMLFGGNLVRQPAFVNLRRQNPDAFRVIGELPGADRIMNQTLFLGVYPGLSKAQLDFMIKVIRDFVHARSSAGA
jgi:CDP-6-deoxy-D-xylo-4-hexulose-3-dehydrase